MSGIKGFAHRRKSGQVIPAYQGHHSHQIPQGRNRKAGPCHAGWKKNSFKRLPSFKSTAASPFSNAA